MPCAECGQWIGAVEPCYILSFTGNITHLGPQWVEVQGNLAGDVVGDLPVSFSFPWRWEWGCIDPSSYYLSRMRLRRAVAYRLGVKRYRVTFVEDRVPISEELVLERINAPGTPEPVSRHLGVALLMVQRNRSPQAGLCDLNTRQMEAALVLMQAAGFIPRNEVALLQAEGFLLLDRAAQLLPKTQRKAPPAGLRTAVGSYLRSDSSDFDGSWSGMHSQQRLLQRVVVQVKGEWLRWKIVSEGQAPNFLKSVAMDPITGSNYFFVCDQCREEMKWKRHFYKVHYGSCVSESESSESDQARPSAP